MIETITKLDEPKILGYFETLRSSFIVKLAWLGATSKKISPDVTVLDPAAFPDELLRELETIAPDPPTYVSLRGQAPEIYLNVTEDIVNGAVLGAWIVFELVVKSLRHADFPARSEAIDANYVDSRFQFEKRETKDLDLFYYLRNAIVHANGAFTAVKAIDHHYAGQHFSSAGREGEKMIVSPAIAFRILKDLERLALKTWVNWHAPRTAV